MTIYPQNLFTEMYGFHCTIIGILHRKGELAVFHLHKELWFKESGLNPDSETYKTVSTHVV